MTKMIQTVEVIEGSIRQAVVDVLWERQYYNGVTKENRYTVGLNPGIGQRISAEAEKVIAAIAPAIRTLTAHIAAPDEVDAGKLSFLKTMLADDIARSGRNESFMIRAGLLSDILAALASTPIPLVDPVREALEKCQRGLDRIYADIGFYANHTEDSLRRTNLTRIADEICQMAELCDRALGSPAVGDGGGNG